jgi:hypothetical protein
MAPFKCPDCGVWWVGPEHRCAQPQVGPGTNAPMEVPWRWTPYVPAPITSGTLRDCICHMKGRTLPEVVICPVHDITTTIYAGNS